MIPLSLYLHIPFCAAKCAYCDFASFPNREGQWRAYVGALLGEMDDWRRKGLEERFEIATVFVGGGTPTLLPGEDIAALLESAHRLAPFRADAEITLEGNPGTLMPERLRLYHEVGVNRLSLGAQSFDDGLLRSLGRIHTAGQIGEAVRMAREAGFDNLNLDLIYALPGQTMAQWRDTLASAAALEVEHLSAYSLIVEPGTPMAGRVARGEAVLPEDDEVNRMQRTAVQMLARAGYARYEISNYARKGRECRHNLVYWNRGDYLGLGCAAHSMLDGCRFANPSDLEAYLRGERGTDRARLTREDAMEETILLSTRTVRGLDLAAWEREFGAPFERGRERVLRRLDEAGYVRMDGGFLSLTPRGLEVQNAVVLELLP